MLCRLLEVARPCGSYWGSEALLCPSSFFSFFFFFSFLFLLRPIERALPSPERLEHTVLQRGLAKM